MKSIMNRQQMDALSCGFQADATSPTHMAWVEQPGLATRVVDLIRRLGETERAQSRQRAALVDRDVVQRRAAMRAPRALWRQQLRDRGIERDQVADVTADMLALVRDQRGALR
jgi:hypothetical protein